ncbi:carbonic anhydrase 7-like [Ostrinia nubilalis]|uniref:carbonic anhydrase 7-like n=1 Tax=Ostrinia nubilalis TaxID=29057 RepID=UPI0030824914
MTRYIFVAMTCFEIVVSTTFKEPLWTYDDETNWPGVNCKEGGKRQSPIDIRTADVVKDYAKQFIKHGQLKFTGYHRVLVSGINNGHTVQFSSEGEEAIHPTLTGGPLEHRYRLEQLHFHWLSEHSVNGINTFSSKAIHPTLTGRLLEQLDFHWLSEHSVNGINAFSSEGEEAIHPTLTGGPLGKLHFHWLSEHSVNGIKFPMEIHFVHVRSDLNVGDALVSKDGLAIISVFCNVQAELDDRQQQASDEIMQYIPKLLETGDRISGVLMDMTKLLSPNQQSYYTYAGSLTSPECNEAVIWIIFDTPIFLSDADYRMFGKVGVGRHNFRSLQKLNHHVVFKPVSASLHTPQIVKLFDDVVKLVTDFFRNVTSFMSKGLRSR